MKKALFIGGAAVAMIVLGNCVASMFDGITLTGAVLVLAAIIAFKKFN